MASKFNTLDSSLISIESEIMYCIRDLILLAIVAAAATFTFKSWLTAFVDVVDFVWLFNALWIFCICAYFGGKK